MTFKGISTTKGEKFYSQPGRKLGQGAGQRSQGHKTQRQLHPFNSYTVNSPSRVATGNAAEKLLITLSYLSHLF